MPYGVTFKKRVPIANRAEYFNECCVGGDAVVDQLLPAIRARYTRTKSNQEDWGWFIWFRKGNVGLAIDVFTDDPDGGEFRIHLTSTKKRLFWGGSKVDMPELEELRELVLTELRDWAASNIEVRHLDNDYNLAN
jgi:hypothetical protein